MKRGGMEDVRMRWDVEHGFVCLCAGRKKEERSCEG